MQIPGTAVGTATDLDGKFSVKVPGNAKEINVSALGYKAARLKPQRNLGTIVLAV